METKKQKQGEKKDTFQVLSYYMLITALEMFKNTSAYGLLTIRYIHGDTRLILLKGPLRQSCPSRQILSAGISNDINENHQNT